MPVKYLYISCRFPRIYEVPNVAYARPCTSHIRDRARRIYETTHVAYTRLGTTDCLLRECLRERFFCIGGVSFYIELRLILFTY